MESEYDIVVVGAGAAGIAAGRRLARTRLSFLIVEASERVGGRAWTSPSGGLPLDLGCGWLHSADRNPWARIAAATGHPIDRTPPAWGHQYQALGFSAAEQQEADAAWEALDRRMREAPPASDRAADALDSGCRWNAYLDARSSYINGAHLCEVSVADALAYDDADSGVNWRLPGGYGALVAMSAAGLPIRCATPVARIGRGGKTLRLETASGVLSARAAIIAVPTGALTAGRLRFDPPLAEKEEAASRLPLGIADKLFLALDQADEFPPDAHLIGNPLTAETGSYYLRPFGRPIIEAFFGGNAARRLEIAGEAAMHAFAMDELAALFGTAFPRRLKPLAASSWGWHAFIGGAYSHAVPGPTDARRVLAAPVEDRLFFAGEACSARDFSTAHGAYASGVEAAERALAVLGRASQAAAVAAAR